jgi:Transposase IS66 family
LARLLLIVRERQEWAQALTQVKGMRQWVLDVEEILSGKLAHATEVVSKETVGKRLDAWRQTGSSRLIDGTLSELEHSCLAHFLQVLANQRSHLVQCYDRDDFPRTNNEMERSIRALKTQYRRISGRKNWNSYLLRYGRCVAYSAWWEQDESRQHQLLEHACRLDRTRWRQMRQETNTAQSEQLKRFRFRHKRQMYLASLEHRWEATAPT